jgi:serine/threonine-protein kinase
MASVYLAQDNRLDRTVAVKVVHPHLGEDYRERFVAEAKIAARLAHPNLVNVFDQGRDDDLAWLAMEYVPGLTLREVMDKFGALSADRALELFEPLLAGLAVAHRSGILHRDLKPENVLLSDDGQIKLSDWGLAREVDQRTQTASLVGTVAYVSPELVLRGAADARSDVYAAGIILFEMLTGKQPFTGDQAVNIAFQHANEQVPAPSSLRADVPELMDEIVLWATAKEPAQRPRDAGELHNIVGRARAELRSTGGFAKVTELAQTQRLAATSLIESPTTAAGDTGATQVIAQAAGGNPTEVISNVGARNDGRTEVIDRPEETLPDEHPLERLEKRGAVAKVLVVSALMVLLGGAIGWFFSAGPGGFKLVPELTGMSQSIAQETLDAQGIQHSLATENSVEVAAGNVIRTEPGGGAPLFGSVKIVVSLGPKAIAVPDIKGKDPVSATAALVAAGLQPGKVESWFNSATIGTVFGYTGDDGQPVLDGTKVDLKVSLGPIPLVSGLDRTAAEGALALAGLKIDAVREDFSDDVAAGKVITIEYPVGSNLGKDSSVTLVVSKGSSLVTVPRVVGETLLAAKTALEALGLVVSVNTDQLQSNWGVAKVKRVSAAAGTQLRVGDSITIFSK